jgi:hypothetical protein
MPLRTAQPALISKDQAAAGNIRQLTNQLRRQYPLHAQALDSVQTQLDTVFHALSTPLPALTEFYVTDPTGKQIFWAGNKAVGGKQYFGIYGNQGYFGGTDASDAPLFIDNTGKVIIGQNGSISVRNDQGTEKGWLGVEVEGSKNVTGAANHGGLIQLTVNGHGYVTGDSVIVANVGGVPNATGDWAVTYIDANHFDLQGSTWAGTYTSGGTAYRYYGGILSQTAAFAGTTFANAKFRCFADGRIVITDATLTLNLNGVTTSVANIVEAFSGSYVGLRVEENSTHASGNVGPGFIELFAAMHTNPELWLDAQSGYGQIDLTHFGATDRILLTAQDGTVDVTGSYKVGGFQVVTTRQSTPTRTTKMAGGTYGANEQAMLNELKAWQDAVHTALSSAAGHGLWT